MRDQRAHTEACEHSNRPAAWHPHVKSTSAVPCLTDQQRERNFTAAYQPPAGASGGKISDLSYAITPRALVFEAHEGLPEDICQPFQRRDRWALQLRALTGGLLGELRGRAHGAGGFSTAMLQCDCGGRSVQLFVQVGIELCCYIYAQGRHLQPVLAEAAQRAHWCACQLLVLQLPTQALPVASMTLDQGLEAELQHWLQAR